VSKRKELPLIATDCCEPMAAEPLAEARATDLARGFKALSDPVRLRLLSMITARDRDEICVCELTPAFEVSAPTISHHLKVLREAGLIDCERRGTWVYYWAIPQVMDALAGVLDTSAMTAKASG
jgi:ArsR family transcriptional regulator